MKLWRHFNYPNSLTFFAFWLPISPKMSTISIFGCLFLLLTEWINNKLTPRIHLKNLILPLLFLLYLTTNLLLSEDYSFTWMERKASLLAFPIIFLGFKRLNFQDIFRTFILGSVVAYLICMVFAFGNSVYWTGDQISFNPLISESRGFFEAIMYEGNYFFSKNFSILLQTSYFGLYLTCAIAILWLTEKPLFRLNIRVIFTILLLAGVLQTLSISAYLGLCISIAVITLTYLKSRSLKWAIPLVILVLAIATMFWQPRVRLMMEDLRRTEFKLNPEGRYGMMLRLLSWDASMEVIREQGLIGVGLPNAQNVLNAKYEQKGYIYPRKQQLNSHNTYLQILIECGVLGLVLLLASLFLFVHNALGQLPKFSALISLFTILIAFNFLFESYLSRYIGVSFFCFFYCLFNSFKESLKTDESASKQV